MVGLHSIIVTHDQIQAAGRLEGDSNAVPVLAHLPRGARLVSSFFDTEDGALHIFYRPGPDMAVLTQRDRIVPLERIAMVSHELIRSYRIAIQIEAPPGWDELDQRDKLAEMGRCSLLRDEGITVSNLFAQSNRITDEKARAVDRVEATLRAVVARAFDLTT